MRFWNPSHSQKPFPIRPHINFRIVIPPDWPQRFRDLNSVCPFFNFKIKFIFQSNRILADPVASCDVFHDAR